MSDQSKYKNVQAFVGSFSDHCQAEYAKPDATSIELTVAAIAAIKLGELAVLVCINVITALDSDPAQVTKSLKHMEEALDATNTLVSSAVTGFDSEHLGATLEKIVNDNGLNKADFHLFTKIESGEEPTEGDIKTFLQAVIDMTAGADKND